MAWMQLPHWIMIGGAFLVIAGFIGLALSRNKAVEADPALLPGDPSKPEHEDLDATNAAP
jgi:hypothetical protein